MVAAEPCANEGGRMNDSATMVAPKPKPSPAMEHALRCAADPRLQRANQELHEAVMKILAERDPNEPYRWW